MAMKPCLWFCLLWTLPAVGGSYSVVWYDVPPATSSTGGVYTASGTLSPPPDAAPMTGGGYSATGGFSGLVNVVQTPGVPTLILTSNGGVITLSWAFTEGVILQQTPDLANPAAWATSPLTLTTTNGISSVTVSSPTGNLFFRLKQ